MTGPMRTQFHSRINVRFAALLLAAAMNLYACFWLLVSFPIATINALMLHTKVRSFVAEKRPKTTITDTSATAASSLLVATILILLPNAAVAGDIGRGQQLFNENCASCHLGGANYINPDRTLRKDALEKYGIGIEPESIVSFVTKQSSRHKNLVFFRVEGGKLTAQQWEDVTAYISDQAKGDKW